MGLSSLFEPILLKLSPLANKPFKVILKCNLSKHLCNAEVIMTFRFLSVETKKYYSSVLLYRINNLRLSKRFIKSNIALDNN